MYSGRTQWFLDVDGMVIKWREIFFSIVFIIDFFLNEQTLRSRLFYGHMSNIKQNK
jgi:hypothetical protein